MSTRSAAIEALTSVLATALGDATVTCNEVEVVRIPTGGLITVRDGEPGEPEVYLTNPPTYAYQHQAEVVVQVIGKDSSIRDGRLTALLTAIAAAVDDDPTLGGAVDWAQAQEAEMGLEPVEGSSPIKAALLAVRLDYLSRTRV